jgi:hypothetical protein
MESISLAKNIAWLAVAVALLGAAGAYRYFIIPAELRFATTEALWIAFSFLGDALVAGTLLILLRGKRSTADDK